MKNKKALAEDGITHEMINKTGGIATIVSIKIPKDLLKDIYNTATSVARIAE